jgi:hypothetical protein
MVNSCEPSYERYNMSGRECENAPLYYKEEREYGNKYYIRQEHYIKDYDEGDFGYSTVSAPVPFLFYALYAVFVEILKFFGLIKQCPCSQER